MPDDAAVSAVSTFVPFSPHADEWRKIGCRSPDLFLIVPIDLATVGGCTKNCHGRALLSDSGAPSKLQVRGGMIGRLMRDRINSKRWLQVRLVLAMLIAVVASLTFHHGTMASQVTPPTAHHGSHGHHQQTDLVGLDDHHALPACCGVGLCLSALPVTYTANALFEPSSTPAPIKLQVATSWPRDRIDRPPRFS